MQSDNLPEYIQHLLQPSSYAHQVTEVQLVQTHISFVTLAGDYVYKWKKPVDFGFLDFSSLEKRHYFCQQELVLNRRLCPEIYLDLVSVHRDGNTFNLSGTGEVVEYGVKMARMPEEKMMSRIIKAGKLENEHLVKIIETLVPFYLAAEGADPIRKFGKAESVAVNVLENFDQTEDFVGCDALGTERFSRLKSYAQEFLSHEELFEQRIAAGRIRDCHGDLYSANICLDDSIHVFDCIEFNERFRYSDVAADVAFLAMDLDFHDLSPLSDFFIDRFIRESGDASLRSVLNFYKCYRAYVRGKIGLFTAADPAVDAVTAANCQKDAQRYFELAERYIP